MSEITLRVPTAEDGMDLHQLVNDCPPLDPNSSYCNLLHCSHFADTAVAADKDGQLVGFISGYLIPSRPDTLFVWQVAVSEAGRGQGLAGRMLQDILKRQPQVKYIETTITKDNEASWGLFKSQARKLDANLESEVFFDKEKHFKGHHDSEYLVKIGPFNTPE